MSHQMPPGADDAQRLANTWAELLITMRSRSAMEVAVLDFFMEIDCTPDDDDDIDWHRLPRYLAEIAGRLKRAEAAPQEALP